MGRYLLGIRVIQVHEQMVIHDRESKSMRRRHVLVSLIADRAMG